MGRSIQVESLTSASFASFGTIAALPERAPDIATDYNRYWDNAIPFRVRGTPQVGFLEVTWRPLVVLELERHLSHTQTFIPLAGDPFVLVVAPPSSDPKPASPHIRAFFLDGSVGVLLHEGTWHHLLFPLVPKAHVILLLQEGTKEHDMHVAPLPRPVEIRF